MVKAVDATNFIQETEDFIQIKMWSRKEKISWLLHQAESMSDADIRELINSRACVS